MAKMEATSLLGELSTATFYKRNQGRLTRQLTAAAIALLVAVGAYTLSQGPLSTSHAPIKLGIPIALAVIGLWVAFRLVNYPPFAEFLISVEGEMNKVSWASWPELYRATVVVLGSMVFLGVVLAVYDLLWWKVLTWLGVLQM